MPKLDDAGIAVATSAADADLLYLVQGGISKRIAKSNLLPASIASLTALENYFGSAVWVMPPPAASGGDQAAAAAKIALINANGGGTLFWLAKNYAVNNIAFCSGLTFAGAGYATVLTRNGNKAPIQMESGDPFVEDIIIRDMTIDGVKTVSPPGQGSGCGIKLDNAKNVTCENLYVPNCYEAGILLSCPTTGAGGKMRIVNVWTHNPAHDSSIDSQTWGGLCIAGGDDVYISGCICTSDDGWQGYGIDIEPVQTWVIRRCIVTNNIIENGSIKVVPVDGATVTDCQVTDNIINCLVSQGGGAGVQLEHCSGIANVSNNDIRTNAMLAGIYARMDSGILKIKNNTATGCSGAMGGIWTWFETTDGIVDICGNDIRGLPTNQDVSPDRIGLLLGGYTGETTHGRVHNNTFQAPSATHATTCAGIRKATSAHLSNIDVRGNQFVNITKRFVAADLLYQDDEIVPTADLPPAAAGRVGLRLIEDAGSSVYNQIDYLTATIRTRTVYGTAF